MHELGLVLFTNCLLKIFGEVKRLMNDIISRSWVRGNIVVFSFLLFQMMGMKKCMEVRCRQWCNAFMVSSRRSNILVQSYQYYVCRCYLFDSSDDHQGFDYLSTGCIGHEKFFLIMPWTLDIEIICKGLQVINGHLQRECVFALSSELVSSVSFLVKFPIFSVWKISFQHMQRILVKKWP